VAKGVKRTKLELEAVYADVEEYLVRVRSHAKIKRAIATKYDVTPKHVSGWIKVVHDRWRAQAGDENRDTKRDGMRATLNELLSMAMNRTDVVRGPDGKIVYEANGEPKRRARPDIQRALHATHQLRALDGLDAPTKVNLSGPDGGPIPHKVTGNLVTPSERNAIANLLKGLKKQQG
jgi:hypothetical protein